MKGGMTFIEPLPSNDTRVYTDQWEGFINCALEMGSVAMIYISSFIKIDSVIPSLMQIA
jgi:hypothetical protein